MPRFPGYDVWSAVVDGVIVSLDVDENMQFSPYQARARVQQQRPLPYQQQLPPLVHSESMPYVAPPPRPPQPPRPTAPRPALAPVDPNLLALGKDISSLEAENDRLKHENTALKRVCNVQRLCVKQLAELATLPPNRAPGY